MHLRDVFIIKSLSWCILGDTFCFEVSAQLMITLLNGFPNLDKMAPAPFG